MRRRKMYEMTQEILSAAGLPAYEVSNHAKPGNESRHNLTYWHYDDYIGIGPGAHGRYCYGRQDVLRRKTIARRMYGLRQVNEEQSRPAACSEEIDPATAQREALMMGLRLTQGIAHESVAEKNSARRLTGEENAFLAPEKIQQTRAAKIISRTDGVQNSQSHGGRFCSRLNAVLGYLLN